MTKSTITKTWIVGLVILAIGLIAAAVSIGLMLGYGGTFTARTAGNGYDFVPRFDGFFWTTVTFAIGGFTAAAVGGVVQLVAWIGALANTYQLPDKAWFVILLLGGLLGLGFPILAFAVMVAYLVAGPEGAAYNAPKAPASTLRPTTLAPTS